MSVIKKTSWHTKAAKRYLEYKDCWDRGQIELLRRIHQEEQPSDKDMLAFRVFHREWKSLLI